MFTVDLPYEIGIFVKVKPKDEDSILYGTVVAYTVGRDGYLIWVSGYKEPMTGEYLPEEIEPMNLEEIEQLKLTKGD